MSIAALLTTVLLVLAPPQDERLSEATVGELVGKVRNSRVDLVDREPAMEELLRRGSPGAKALAEEMQRQGERLSKTWAKLEKSLLKDFGRAAPKLIEDRLGRKTQSEIDELRATVLSHSRDGGLTKETVVGVCDPAVARLDELLGISPAQVFEEDEDLEELRAEAERVAQDTWIVADWWRDAVEVLEADPESERARARLREPDDLDGRYRALEAQLAELARRATPMTSRDADAFDANDELREELDPEELEGVRMLNLRRVRLGLAALKVDMKLTRASRGHSKDMVERGFFAHDSPVPGKETPWKRAALEGTSASAENIAAGQSTGEDATRAWWYSPGHHRNMMGGHARIGLGRYESTWTQLFGG